MRVDQRLCYISTLPDRQKRVLDKYQKLLNATKQCIEQNSRIIEKIIANVDKLFCNSQSSTIEPLQQELLQQDPDSDKVHITLKQIVRDWCDLGLEEREQCYKPILNALAEHFDLEKMRKNQFKVLVPGAGLGRLVYEISLRGFFCEGNEFSLFMLIASNFVLNKCILNDQYEIHPFCHQFVNNMRRDDSLTACRFPDVSPFQHPPKGEMTMIAGDFLQIYSSVSQIGQWDSVCTCFFIDCANNVIDFIEIIYNILRSGGIWINLGPLLYHYCDVPSEISIEPSYEDLRLIIENTGFKFIKETLNVKTKYSQNNFSMAHLEYDSVFFVVQKPNEEDRPKTSESPDNEQNVDDINTY